MNPARPGAPSSSKAGIGVWRRPSPLVRRVLVLCALAAVSVAAVTASNRVAIEVDGRTVSLRSYADTVDDALVAAGIEVGPGDLVAPGLHTPVVDGLVIDVARAPVVALTAPTSARTPAPARTPAQASASEVGVGQSVTARVRADGKSHLVRLPRGTVADALARAGITAGAHDRLSHTPDTPLGTDTTTITVVRRDHEQVVEEVRLPFHEDVVHTAELFEDEQVVVQEGAEGTRVDTYRLTRVDGKVVDRALVSQDVITEPVHRVVHVGTTPRPAPPPEPAPPPPEPEPAPPPDAADDSVWDRLAQCESHGNWAAQGHYHGGLQFHPDTWSRWKPDGYPAYAYEASREQQIEVGKRLHSARGWSPWPHCAEELGLQ